MSERARKAKRFGAFVVFALGLAVAMAANVIAAQHHEPGVTLPEGADRIGLAVGVLTGLAFGAVAIAHNFLSPPATGHPREKALRVLMWIMGGTTFLASYLHTWEVTKLAGETNPLLRALLSGIPDGVMFMGTALVEALAPTPQEVEEPEREPAAEPDLAPVLIDTQPEPVAVEPAPVAADHSIEPEPVEADLEPTPRAPKRSRPEPVPSRKPGKADAIAHLDEHGDTPRGELAAKVGVSDGTAGAALREWRSRQAIDSEPVEADTGGDPSLNGHRVPVS